MEQALTIFEPLKNPAVAMLLPGLAFAAFGVAAGAMLFNHNMERNRRLLLAMLFFFASAISLFSVGGSAINAYKFRRVTVSASSILVGNKEIPYSNLRGYLIREDRRQSWVNSDIQQKGVRSLVLEEKSGKTHLLPEEYYELPRMVAALDSAFTKWKEER